MSLSNNSLALIEYVAARQNKSKATFDQLAEEVMELHLAMREKHSDTPAMEWLEIASIAINAFQSMPVQDQREAFEAWNSRHGETKC